MGRAQNTELNYASDQLAGASIIGGVILGGLISLVIWTGIIGLVVL